MREYYRPSPPEAPPKDAPKEFFDSYKKAYTQYIESSKLSNISKDGSKKRKRYHHGLIAQEVQSLLNEKGIDFGGIQDHKLNGGDDVLSIGYMELIAPLIKAVQELSDKIKKLEDRIQSSPSSSDI